MKRIIFYYITCINVLAFILMYSDKRKAIKGKWRISEKRLFLVSACGGSIGSIVGMYLFNHKTKHTKFTIGLPVLLILQIIIIYLLIFKFNFI